MGHEAVQRTLKSRWTINCGYLFDNDSWW